MRFVNRALVVLRARQPYVDWANRFREGGAALVLEAARSGGSAFLIPAFDRDDDVRDFIERRATAMFEHELEMWLDDESRWPPTRDAATFHAWFEVEIHDIVVDLGEDAILTEELG